MKPIEAILDFAVTIMEVSTPCRENQTKAPKTKGRLVFVKCGEPAESAADKASSRKGAEETEGAFGKAFIMFLEIWDLRFLLLPHSLPFDELCWEGELMKRQELRGCLSVEPGSLSVSQVPNPI